MRQLAAGIVVVAWLAVAVVVPALAGDSAEGFGVVDVSSGVWYLRDPGSGDTTSFNFGNPGDYPMMGDWDCDGVDTPGLYRQSDGFVYLRNSNTQGAADVRFFLGNPGDVPLAGDFNGDGCDTVSVFRPLESRVFVINELGADEGGLGAAEFDYTFGNPGDDVFVGDFDGDGIDTVGLHRESTGLVYFRNSHTQGVSDAQFVFGNPGDRIMAGKWTESQSNDTVGIFRPSQGTVYLRYANAQGTADEQHAYGNSRMVPISGNFGTLPGNDDPPPATVTARTTPPNAVAPSGIGVLWSDGFETGDLSRWLTPAISGKASVDIVNSPVHSGNHSLRLTNRDVDGSHSAGARMTPNTDQWRPPTSKYPDDMYYSAWYFIPFAFEGKSNAFQFKMSDAIAWDRSGEPTAHTWRMIWKISLDWDAPSGKYRMEMATRVNQATGAWRSGEPDTLSVTQPLVPVGEWFHVETRYVWGKNRTGRTTVWLNGEQVWNQGNMSTEPNNLECLKWCRTWAVNHYLGDWQGYVAPGDSWIVIDDARLSTTRAGTG